MNKEATKKTAQVMLDWADGKEIQFRPRGCGNEPWETFVGKGDLEWDLAHWEFRTKPEPHYRPFESAEEVMEAIKEHGDLVIWKANDTWRHKILSFSPVKIRTSDGDVGMQSAFEDYIFADGTPFGKLVED